MSMGRLIIVIALIAVAILLWYAFGPRRRSSDSPSRGLFTRGQAAEPTPPSDPSVNYPQGWNGRGGSYWHHADDDGDDGSTGGTTGSGKRPIGPDDDPDFLNKL